MPTNIAKKEPISNKVDYLFISNLEGGRHTTAYVPAIKESKSGVTLATGFDLGQRNEADLRALNLSERMIVNLSPYMGKKSDEAYTFLKNNPLVISMEEAEEIDLAYREPFLRQLKIRYRTAPQNRNRVDFLALQSSAQTVIASVGFQYGNLAIRTPVFWKHVTSQDWAEAVKCLNDFGDAYPTRRRKEAALLAELVK